MRTVLHWPTLNAMVFGLGLCLVLSAITTTTSHAILLAGDYMFTSGLTGTFTSDGTKLTTYNLTDPLGSVWTTPLPPGVIEISNDAFCFSI